MRRLLGLKDSTHTHSSNAKDKQRRDSTSASMPLPDPSSSRTPMEVHVSTEVHSAPDRKGFRPLTSTTSLVSSSPASSQSGPQSLPPEIRVATHPYPYWQACSHTPPSSSQSSLESPSTPSHVSWLNTPNGSKISFTPPPALVSQPVAGPSSSTHSLVQGRTSPSPHLPPAPVPQPVVGPSSSTHFLVQGRSSPSPHFPPPPPTSPPPNISARPKLLHPTKSSHSLRVPVQESFNQQLSPIVEQDYLSPEKRPSSLPSSSHEGGGSRSSTAHTARTSAAIMTPVSPVSDGVGATTMTPVSPVPITPVLVSARGVPHAPQSQAQTPVTPGGVLPFARRKEEEGNDSPPNDIGPSPVSTFILRPLNRSISLSSTRTHQSSGSSATAPIIPPLDLKPEFKGQAFLTTPTSLHSRGLLDVGAHDDDSVSDRRASFVTAQTGPGRESRYSLGQEEVFVDAEEGYRRDSNGTIHPFDFRLLEDTVDTTPTPQPIPIHQTTPKPVKPPIPARIIMHVSGASSSPPSYNYPSGSNSSDNPPHPNPHPHRPIPPFSMYPSRSGASAPSLHELGASTSASSSFIDRRFAPSSLYFASASDLEAARKEDTKWRLYPEHVDTVQILFWIGFVSPWCWLIGGWLVSPKRPPQGHASDTGHGHGKHKGLDNGRTSLLPLLSNRSKSAYSLDTTTRMHHGYPFVAPSVLTLTPPPPPYQSQRTLVVLTPKPVELQRRGSSNPYVRRCRIAAVTSGVLIAIAFLVAVIVVGTRH